MRDIPRWFLPEKEKVPLNKIAKLLLIACGVMLLAAAPAMAADEGGGAGSAVDFSKYFGVGLTVIGAAYGIGKLAASAYEGMSRQPEVAGNIQMSGMIIAAALIEGATFFGLIVCIIVG